MSEFQSGVRRYVRAQAVVDVFFPVDSKGNADISCSQCYYFREASKRCGLNMEICQYPHKYVGDSCPLHRLDDDTGEIDNV